MKKSLIYILILLLTLATGVSAQTFTAQASKSTVSVGERFQISFTLNSSGNKFIPPNLDNFDVYSGPNQSSSMSYVNGKMTQSVSLSYILAAKKEGSFTIDPASVDVSGKTLKTNPLTIEVKKGSTQPQQQQSNKSPGNATEDNIFAKAEVNKTKAYVGEEITVTYKIYTRYDVRGFQNFTFPDYQGFWVNDLESDNTTEASTEVVNGVSYRVGILKRSFVYPQRSGKLEISPMTVDCIVRQQDNRQPRSFIEQMMGVGYKDVSVPLKSKPVSITVLALPEADKPKNFSGAVGNYKLQASVNKEKLKANDAINLNITLSGKGNIKVLSPPEYQFPEDFETYEPKIKTNAKADFNGFSGSKSFDYLLIPRHDGTYEINNLDFSYFDPSKKKYITLKAPTFKLEVEKGDDNLAASSNYTTVSKEDVKVLGNDIHYIATQQPKLHSKNQYFFGSPLFYTGIASPLLAFLAFILYRKKQEELNKDVVSSKSRKAGKIAKKRLAAAEAHLKENKKEEFYLELSKALFGYLGNKFNISQSDLSKEHIEKVLKNKNIGEEITHQLLSTIDTCEYARYAPSTVSGDLQEVYNNTVELIIKIEDAVK